MGNPDEERALRHIQTDGYHVVWVPGDFTQTSYGYSIGIERTFGQPDLVVTGLGADTVNAIIAHYVSLLRSGATFAADCRYGGFLDDKEIIFKPVDRINYPGHFGWALWLYESDTFRILQVVYPSSSDTWPWDPDPPAGYVWDMLKLYTEESAGGIEGR